MREVVPLSRLDQNKRQRLKVYESISILQSIKMKEIQMTILSICRNYFAKVKILIRHSISVSRLRHK